MHSYKEHSKIKYSHTIKNTDKVYQHFFPGSHIQALIGVVLICESVAFFTLHYVHLLVSDRVLWAEESNESELKQSLNIKS